MKKILFSFVVLLFLAAGICFTVLYSIGTRAIEDSIIHESTAGESTQERQMKEAAPGTTASDGKTANQESKAESSKIKPKDIPADTAKSDNKDSAAAPTEDANGSSQQKKVSGSETVALESVDKIQKNVPITEKISLTNLLLSKLTPSDISELKGMLSNGITAEEKQRAKEILYSRLSSDDINKIKEAYAKYTEQ